jgi:YHS domain-containing protein
MGRRICAWGETRWSPEGNDCDDLQERNMTMEEAKAVTKDPVCGMTVDKATALHAERDGKTFHFCSDRCRDKFLSAPAVAKPANKSRGCCG